MKTYMERHSNNAPDCTVDIFKPSDTFFH